MSGPIRLKWTPDGVADVAAAPGARWLRGLRRLRVATEAVEVRVDDDAEGGALVLGGTLDLEANSGAWPARGLRADVFGGRPVAIYLPPRTRFRASAGDGEVLVVSARQPAPPPAPPDTPASADAPEAKPLLPLAGSNKAFDSRTGSWQPIESFPDSPEAILPRRIARERGPGLTVERVFPRDYKSRGLGLCEAVLAEGSSWRLPGPDAAGDYPGEWAAFVRTEGLAVVGDLEVEAGDDAAFLGDGAVEVRAVRGRCYVAAALAGDKPAGA